MRKKGIVVTENNMAMVFGHVKKFLRNKDYILERTIETKNIKVARRYLTRNYLPVLPVGKPMKVTFHRGDFKQQDVMIKRIPSARHSKYIVVRDSKGIENTIYIGDRVHINNQAIFSYRHNPTAYSNKSEIKIWI